MSDDRYIYEAQKAKLEAQKNTITAIVTVFIAVAVISGILGGIYLMNMGKASEVKLTPDSCQALCKESGVESFDEDECKCREPRPAAPVVIKASDLELDCKVKNVKPEELLGVSK